MNIQDIKYILAVIREGSVNKAAHALYLPQPSLSKCIMRVEKEYNMKLFLRSKGSRLELTQEGILFQAAAVEILNAEQGFTAKLKKIQEKSRNHIFFGTTPQRAYRIGGPLLQWIFQHHSEYLVEIQTNSTEVLKQNLLEGTVDAAFFVTPEFSENGQLCSVPISAVPMCIYLRPGAPAAAKAVYPENGRYGILHLEDLAGDPVVANVKGSSSREILEALLQKNNMELPIIERSNWYNRVSMVKQDLANYMMQLGEAEHAEDIDQSRIFLIAPEQNVLSRSCLVCRKEFRSDPRFTALWEALQSIYEAQLAGKA